MKSLLNRFRTLGRRKKIVLGASMSIVFFSLWMAQRSSGVSSAPILVTRGSISQTVSVTGSLKAAEKVDLSFQNSGRVAFVGADVGASVSAGQVLASLDSAELQAQLRDARASLLAQQARLDELTQGPRTEDLAIKRSEFSKAQQDLQNAYENATTVLSDALTKADTAVHNQLEGIFDEVGTITYPSYKLTFSCFCDQFDLTVNSERGDVETALTHWRQEVSALNGATSTDVRLSVLQNARQYLQTTKIMLENIGFVLNHPTVSLPADTATAYRTAVSAARTSVIAAQTSVSTQQQLIGTYQLALDRVSGELAKLLNGSTVQALAVQRAQVQSAQAQVERVQALISKNFIISPIAGVLTKQDAKVGQNASPNIPMVSVISEQQLEMEANVPEVDIGKIAVNDDIALTVDALPGETFRGRVTSIDPAETVIDGVVNFRILAQLEKPDVRLKSGLTVNMDIVSERRDDVLLLPQFAIIENNAGTFVRRQDGTQAPVVVGIRSQDGIVEIVSGLTEGDSVMNIGLKSAK